MLDSPTLAEVFKDAKVHFTHFGKAEGPAMLSDEAAWIAMSRGMAWQFYNQQYAADIGIPILLWDARLGRYVMSILVIQVTNQKNPLAIHIDLEDKKSKFFTEHESNEMFNMRPYITLSLQLGVQMNKDLSRQRPATPTRQRMSSQQQHYTHSKLTTGQQAQRTGPPRAAKAKTWQFQVERSSAILI